MTVHWETSKKPLFIKTVWIRGHRHAILSDHLQLLSYRTIKQTNQKESPQSSSDSYRSSEPDDLVDLLIQVNVTSQSLNLKLENKTRQSSDTCRTHNNSDKKYSPRNTHKEEEDTNSLSERVLQWLDLAGKIPKCITTKKTKQSHIKSSYHKDKVHDYNPYIEMNKESKPKAKKSGSRRSSLTEVSKFNKNNEARQFIASGDIEKYAKQTIEHKKTDELTNRKVVKANNLVFDHNNDTETVTNKSKRNKYIESKKQESTETDDSEFCDSSESKIETKKPIPKHGSFEKEYAELIRKKIVETALNPTATRRQLHIFIPSLPKNATDQDSNSTNKIIEDNESSK